MKSREHKTKEANQTDPTHFKSHQKWDMFTVTIPNRLSRQNAQEETGTGSLCLQSWSFIVLCHLTSLSMTESPFMSVPGGSAKAWNESSGSPANSSES